MTRFSSPHLGRHATPRSLHHAIAPTVRRAFKHTVFDHGIEVDHPWKTLCGFEGFHRTEADRREPRSVVTAKLLGDPAPGRSAQDRLTRK